MRNHPSHPSHEDFSEKKRKKTREAVTVAELKDGDIMDEDKEDDILESPPISKNLAVFSSMVLGTSTSTLVKKISYCTITQYKELSEQNLSE